MPRSLRFLSAISKKNSDLPSGNMTKCCISTAQKLIRASNTLSIPIYATTQSSARLGPLCSELIPTASTSNNHNPIYTIDKTAFSMFVPELRYALSQRSPEQPYQIAIVGIETHICVTQTALDLLSEGHRVYIITDGVSSCHEAERGVALQRLRNEGAIVTTSESFLYECMGDAGIPEFKDIAGLVKDTKETTRAAVQTLCKI
ncbi:hypothetical protein ACLMJK_004942 [Lecanora helva]